MRKRFSLAWLGLLAGLALGLYSRQYLAVASFALWIGFEVWSRRGAGAAEEGAAGRFASLSSLLSLYSQSDETSETLLYQKISELRVDATITQSELRWLERLKELMQLRGLVFGGQLEGKKGLRQAFAYSVELPKKRMGKNSVNASLGDLTLQDLMESAIVVADLYWKLYETGSGDYGDLTKMARRLFTAIFGVGFESDAAKEKLEKLTDSMQRDGGVPFALLNLLRRGETDRARELSLFLLTLEHGVDEEIRSSLYWISEIYSFSRELLKPLDYESTIRYLYHLCFTDPDRAGFLEIDSQFYSQFETVNELAREGFLFKDGFFERVLDVWARYEGLFDAVLQSVMETLTQRKSKIYNERENWVRFWRREGDQFSRDHLYVVEGNLAYASGFYDDACVYYEKALALNPKLRAARLNLLFSYAQLRKYQEHGHWVDRLVKDASVLPSALYMIGNSFLIMGEKAKADSYYNILKTYPGWERKTDYYKSTFCYENGLFEAALDYARQAFKQMPGDASVSYHLSLCYNALGEKDEALAMLKRMNEAPQWLNYYRFTLERDAGHVDDASETLLRIPSDYFQDPDELQEAMEFARGQKDLTLLRHLKRSK